MSSFISERPSCTCNAKLQPVVVGDADVISPLVLDENRVGNHRNPQRRAFKLTGLEWKRVALFHFCFCFRCYLCIFKIRHFIYPCHESKTRALHSHYGSLSTNIMHHRWLFLCGLSLEFHIWPSKPLLAGWVITLTSLFLSLCCFLSLTVFLFLPLSFLSQGFLLIGLQIGGFLTTTSLEATATLVKEYCANFFVLYKNWFLSLFYTTLMFLSGSAILSVASWKCSVLWESVLLVDDTSKNY